MARGVKKVMMKTTIAKCIHQGRENLEEPVHSQPDRNGNVYPRAVMERAIVGWQGTGRVEGEPNNLSHVAFVVNDLHMVDDEVWAKFKSLETLAGLRLRQLIELGGRVDFGIEGTGSTVAGVAQPNFHLTGVVAYWQPPPLPPP